MGNENERKRDPAENRENRAGHQWDDVKTGDSERNVGLTGDAGFGPGGAGVTGSSAGTAGVVGGSAEFLSGQSQDQSGYGSQGGPAAGSTDQGVEEIGSEAKQVLTGDQGGGGSFGGQSGSGTSAIAANNSSADLGAGGPPGAAGRNQQGNETRSSDEPRVGPGGQSEIGGASDLGGGETGQGDGGGFIGSRGDESSDYLRKNGNPEDGFAERGRGAPKGSEPDSTKGSGKPTADRH